MSSNVLTLDVVLGRQTAFELSNFDNSVPKIENYFKTYIIIGSLEKDKYLKDEGSLDLDDKEMGELESKMAIKSC